MLELWLELYARTEFKKKIIWNWGLIEWNWVLIKFDFDAILYWNLVLTEFNFGEINYLWNFI